MKFRYDIQALRGYAVLVILLFHAGIGPFKSGFLGVDIFFVISGFLITTLLVKHLEQGDFSFTEFYFRRAKRLLPAAYTVIFFTIIGSYYFLTSHDFVDFQEQVLGSVTFTANFVLLDQSDYFGGEAKIKPLLHMWSLAVEEQFYLFLPLALFFVPRHLWKWGGVAGVLISLAGCLYFVNIYPVHTFYLLPLRAWELGLGCLGALYLQRPELTKIYKVLFWPSVLILFIIPIIPTSNIHPHTDALLVCLATLIIILRRWPVLDKNIVIRPLAKLGDFSYSLYLVHWPLFAFAANIYVSEIPLSVRALLLSVSIILSLGLYYAVERPLHRVEFGKRRAFIIPLILCSVALIAMVYSLGRLNDNSEKDYAHIFRTNYGLDISCSDVTSYEPFETCQTSAKPRIMVWGDSYAMHLVTGLESVFKEGVIQATMSSCAPILNLSRHRVDSADWARECVEFNNSVFRNLEGMDTVEYVVLSSSFSGLNGETGSGIKKQNNEFLPIIYEHDIAIEAFKSTIEGIRGLGKKVVIVSPMPKNGYDIGRCLERKDRNRIIIGNTKCKISWDTAYLKYRNIYNFLERLSLEADVNVIRLDDFLCVEGVCKTELNGKFLYRDSGHLSYEGADALFKEYNLIKHIQDKAH